MKAVYFEERWLPITEKSVPGVMPGYYMISDEGRVWSNVRNTFLKPTPTWNGYYRVCLAINHVGSRYYLIHRIVMIEFACIPTYMDMQINHFNGDKSKNVIWNLEWMTASANIQHAFNNGLKIATKGEDCSYATITNEQADQIGYLLATTDLQHKQIAEMIGCSKSVVTDISVGSTWKSVYEKYNLESRKKQYILRLSDQELHALCQYWQEHHSEYAVRADLFRASLRDLFGIEYTNNMSPTLGRLYNKQTRKEIVDLYNF